MKTKLNIFFLAALSFLLYSSGASAQCSSTSAAYFSGSDEDEFFTSVSASATGGGVSTVSYSFPFSGSYYGPDVTYINQSSQGVTAAVGATVTVNVTRYAYHYNATLSIYVDWNNDGTFESTDLVGTPYTFVSTATGPANYSFTIPASATTGVNLPMRIFSSEGGSAPCDGTYGQSMDLYLHVCNTPAITVTPASAILCSGSTDSLTATGATAYSWQPAIGLSSATGAAVAATPSVTTTYTITGTVAGGCSNTDTQTVTVVTTPAISITTSATTLCSGNPLLLTITDTSGDSLAYTYSGTGISDTTTASSSMILMPNISVSSSYTYTVVATSIIGGCTDTAYSSAININPLPNAYTVTGTGSYCAGGMGLPISLDSSDNGINYQLYEGGTAVGSAVAGTSSAIGFGTYTTAGTYMVIASNSSTGCKSMMDDSVVISINPLPNIYDVTGTGSYCAGDTGLAVGLDGSDAGISYQLYAGDTTAVGSLTAGTSLPLSFGTYTAATSYVVIAANPTTGCKSTMNDSAVITINPLPNVYPVSGGGAYCAGSAGAVINIDSSDIGILYSLVYDSMAAGTPLAGTGTAMSFGAQSVTGTYEVGAYNPVTGCIDSMSGTATITVDSVPVPTATITATPGLAVANHDTCTFTATITNGGSAPAYQWYVNGVAVPGATSMTFSSDSLVGDSVSFAVMNTDMCGSTDTTTVHITQSLSVSQLSLAGISAQLVPNPNNGVFTIAGSLGSTQTATVTLEITDMTGRSVYSNQTTAPNGVINESIHLNNTLPAGMYLLHVHSGNDNAVFHFVLKQ